MGQSERRVSILVTNRVLDKHSLTPNTSDVVNIDLECPNIKTIVTL